MSSADNQATSEPTDEMGTLVTSLSDVRPTFDFRQPVWRPTAFEPFSSQSQSNSTTLRSQTHQDRPAPQMASRPLPAFLVGSVEEPRQTTVHQPYYGGFTSDPNSFNQREAPPFSPTDSQTRSNRQSLHEPYAHYGDSPTSRTYSEYEVDLGQRSTDSDRQGTRYHTRRRPFNQDEFDGPAQLLPLPLPQQENARSQSLGPLPVHLEAHEQDDIIRGVNDILAACAFHFVAKYQFPVPLERDKPRVRSSGDREWTEWAYLLKRLATKRRIPARVLYDNQIKQLVTTLENSIAVRQTTRAEHQPRQLRDDRYVLQLISAGIQVARILVDSLAMEQLDDLYRRTESVISERRAMSHSAMGYS